MNDADRDVKRLEWLVETSAKSWREAVDEAMEGEL
jgi:hypothetical protein